MSEYKDKLLKKVKEHLSVNPQDAPEFLDAVSSALKEYKETVKREREGLTTNAIINLISLVKPYKGKYSTYAQSDYNLLIPSILPALVNNFPHAKPMGNSNVEIWLYEEFVKLCRDSKYFEGTKNEDWLESFGYDEVSFLDWVRIFKKENNLD